jgi:hypothetical protein
MMSTVRFETLYSPAEQPCLGARLQDVRLAAALLAGAASMAEAELAGSTAPALEAARPLQKIISACNDFERAMAPPAKTMGIVDG